MTNKKFRELAIDAMVDLLLNGYSTYTNIMRYMLFANWLPQSAYGITHAKALDNLRSSKNNFSKVMSVLVERTTTLLIGADDPHGTHTDYIWHLQEIRDAANTVLAPLVNEKTISASHFWTYGDTFLATNEVRYNEKLSRLPFGSAEHTNQYRKYCNCSSKNEITMRAYNKLQEQLEMEAAIQAIRGNTGNYNSGNFRKPRSYNTGRGVTTPKRCYNCNKIGHFARNCYQYRRYNNQSGQGNQSAGSGKQQNYTPPPNQREEPTQNMKQGRESKSNKRMTDYEKKYYQKGRRGELVVKPKHTGKDRCFHFNSLNGCNKGRKRCSYIHECTNCKSAEHNHLQCSNASRGLFNGFN